MKTKVKHLSEKEYKQAIIWFLEMEIDLVIIAEHFNMTADELAYNIFDR